MCTRLCIPLFLRFFLSGKSVLVIITNSFVLSSFLLSSKMEKETQTVFVLLSVLC